MQYLMFGVSYASSLTECASGPRDEESSLVQGSATRPRFPAASPAWGTWGSYPTGHELQSIGKLLTYLSLENSGRPILPIRARGASLHAPGAHTVRCREF